MSITNRNRGLWNAMPDGTFALLFIQVVSTLSFSVLYSTLVLYMKSKLGMQASTANSIMGVFIAFNFGLHLLGGYWGGRLLSNRSLFCVGMVAQTIGCILLSFDSITFLNYGLAAFLTGSGLNVTCLNCMLTQRFSPQDSRRETAFLWNYAGMNIGFFVGYGLSGFFQMTQNYHTLFLLSSLGNVLALILCLYYWQQLADIQTAYSIKTQSERAKASLYGMGFIVLLPILLSQLLDHADWANKLVLLTGLSMFILILFIAGKQSTKEAKNKIRAFALLMLVGIVFWMLYQIGPMGLTFFIEHNVQREYANWMIPPQWFQNINTLAIVIGGPLMGIVLHKMRHRGWQINIPAQFALSLLCIGIAFAILPLGIFNADSAGMVNPGWVVASFVLQSIGELLISPIGYAMIGSLAPVPLQGIMMGMWMLSTGVGATLSSYSSNLMIIGQQSSSPLVTNEGYSQVFLALGLFAIATSVVLTIFIPMLRRLMQDTSIKNGGLMEAVYLTGEIS